MKNEKNLAEKGGSGNEYENINKFLELFVLLQSGKPSQQYKDAYDEAAQLAKNFIATKSKSAWDPTNFETDIKERYPDISQDFINALKRCIENYNPAINIPSKPLWE